MRPGEGPARSCALGALLLGAWLASGCAASISEIEGLYAGGTGAQAGGRPVRVEFALAHLTQRHGYDAVPKHRGPLVSDFEEIFRDATSELGNLSAYTLRTELAPGSGTEIVLRPDYRTDHDYSIRMRFLSESSFAADVLAGLLALGTASIVPAPFRTTYTVSAEVRSADGRVLATFSRSARITQWVEGMLIFAYPFRPPEGEREKLVSKLLRDLFREMNAKQVLLAGRPAVRAQPRA